jgi:uncharacterized protein YoxC
MDEEVEIILQQDSVEVTEPLVADYILPTASSNTLGGVKIGDNINIDNNGHISVPTAGSNVAGVIKVGAGLTIDSNGVLSQDTSTLPQATKNTLGVVYVDDELDDNSQNPVQNAVVSLELAEITGTTDGLANTVDGLSTTVGNLSTTVENLSTTVGNLSTAVDNNTNAIGTCNSNISTINDSISDINDDITALGNGLSTLQGTVDPLVVRVTEEAQYSDITTGTWTSGSIQLFKRGYMGVIYSTLEGSLTIGANSSEVLYTMQDTDYLPTYEATGYIISDLGMIRVGFNTSGEFEVFNDDVSSITITELKGNLPIVFV